MAGNTQRGIIQPLDSSKIDSPAVHNPWGVVQDDLGIAFGEAPQNGNKCRVGLVGHCRNLFQSDALKRCEVGLVKQISECSLQLYLDTSSLRATDNPTLFEATGGQLEPWTPRGG